MLSNIIWCAVEVVCHIKDHKGTWNTQSVVQPVTAYDIEHQSREHEC